jgi:hypothetical protein
MLNRVIWYCKSLFSLSLYMCGYDDVFKASVQLLAMYLGLILEVRG